MKNLKLTLSALLIIAIFAVIGCASGSKVKIVELENKGTLEKISAPDWIKSYISSGISKVQSQSEFRDKYCIIGEESGENKQFVLAWADTFSAQQRIGAMLRTNIGSEYRARVQGASQSRSGANSTTSASASAGVFNQEIENMLSTVVNVSYSGAQRESDWWSLRRRYDPDIEGQYTDEYIVYVLYTIPKSELNRQVARVMETSTSKDSALYDITIEMARRILQEGIPGWGAREDN